MAQSIPEIYPKLREALEQFLHDRAEWKSKCAELEHIPQGPEKWTQVDKEAIDLAKNFEAKFRKGAEVDLAEEDIVSMEDLAVACAKPLFWSEYAQDWTVYRNSYPIAEDLLCLLKPVEEELLTPPGPTHRIWEIFAAAETQHRQFSIVAVYAGFERSLPETNELVQSMQAKFKGLLSSFQHVQLQMERQGLLSSELGSKMTGFAMRLKSYCKTFVASMMTRWGGQIAQKQLFYAIKPQLQRMTQRWERLSAEAAQIAAAVKELELPEVNSLGSWSLVESLEVGSVASGHSVDSQTSCLSGRGGPHCFLPSQLFKSLQVDDELSSKSSVWAIAKDLQKGSKILAADGTSVEVIKLEVQKTNKLLEIDDAVPFTTTPSHRIVVPSEGDDMTIKAVDLKLGSWVMCSDDMAKKVEEQEVLAITFHPDKAVACFLPPEEPVVLTKGRTLKPPRRGGMGSRGSKHELVSIPDTAPGEYDD